MAMIVASTSQPTMGFLGAVGAVTVSRRPVGVDMRVNAMIVSFSGSRRQRGHDHESHW
jgi:hypothetical protein